MQTPKCISAQQFAHTESFTLFKIILNQQAEKRTQHKFWLKTMNLIDSSLTDNTHKNSGYRSDVLKVIKVIIKPMQ